MKFNEKFGVPINKELGPKKPIVNGEIFSYWAYFPCISCKELTAWSTLLNNEIPVFVCSDECLEKCKTETELSLLTAETKEDTVQEDKVTEKEKE